MCVLVYVRTYMYVCCAFVHWSVVVSYCLCTQYVHFDFNWFQELLFTSYTYVHCVFKKTHSLSLISVNFIVFVINPFFPFNLFTPSWAAPTCVIAIPTNEAQNSKEIWPHGAILGREGGGVNLAWQIHMYSSRVGEVSVHYHTTHDSSESYLFGSSFLQTHINH